MQSKKVFGDIFQQLIIREETLRLKEQYFKEYLSAGNRVVMQKAKAKYTIYLKFEESYWQQKVGCKYFENGERNTTFFYSLAKGKRQRLRINII